MVRTAKQLKLGRTDGIANKGALEYDRTDRSTYLPLVGPCNGIVEVRYGARRNGRHLGNKLSSNLISGFITIYIEIITSDQSISQ